MTVGSASLGSLCEIKSGGTPSKAIAAYWNGDIPWVSPKDMKSTSISVTEDHISSQAVENSATCVVPKGSILVVVRSGILVHTLPVATIAQASAFNQDIKALIPDATLVEPDYLYWFIRATAPMVIRQGVKKGATVHSLQSGFLEALHVPLPPRSEQLRLVDLISRAEGIVNLRREAQYKCTNIIPALFVDMFGDPASNPKRWCLRKVADFVDRFEGGKNLQAGSEGCTEFRILKVSAVTTGSYIEGESKPTPENYVPPHSHVVRVGDLLFSRANTVELVGATAIVEETNGYTLLPDKLWRFVWSEAVEPHYIHALFQNVQIRRMIGNLSSGTSASMRNISQAKLFSLELPFAPLERQQVFARHVERLQLVLKQQLEATTKAQRTLDTLLASAFSKAPHYSSPSIDRIEECMVSV